MSQPKRANECERGRKKKLGNLSLDFNALSQAACPARFGEQEFEPTSGKRVNRALALEPQVSSLHSQSDFHDSESEMVDLKPWFAHYKRCTQHFLDHGQYTPIVQSLAVLINIRLPFQRLSHPVDISRGPLFTTPSPFAPLRQYIRRLIVTAQDSPAILRAFFGDAWEAGVSCILEEERVNYLFTAKSSGWASTKAAYDILPDEQTPFLRPLRSPSEDEIQTAEARWKSAFVALLHAGVKYLVKTSTHVEFIGPTSPVFYGGSSHWAIYNLLSQPEFKVLQWTSLQLNSLLQLCLPRLLTGSSIIGLLL
ncbi:hypothetical protein N7499_004301 [Penicillium canescens]|nr:hypothetical protein N7499_004301 [Penicillium canescens]